MLMRVYGEAEQSPSPLSGDSTGNARCPLSRAARSAAPPLASRSSQARSIWLLRVLLLLGPAAVSAALGLAQLRLARSLR